MPPQLRLAALRDHPEFPNALRTTAIGMLDLYNGGRMIGWFLSDRALAILAHAVIALDADASDEDPQSGLTPGRFKAFCARAGMCSEGRATAILAFMRLSGHLVAESHAADGRITRLRPSDKMVGALRLRLRNLLANAARVCPEVAAAADRLDEPEFVRAMSREFLRRWTIGARLVDHAPDLRLFFERDSGVMVLFALMLGGDPSDPMPHGKSLPLSIAPLARRLRVSRTHILRLLREAEATGLLSRIGEKGEQVAFSPRLQDGLRNLVAASFQLGALCALQAEAEARA